MTLRSPPATLLLLLVLGGCAPEVLPDWTEADGYRWRELTVPRRGGPGFTAMSARRTDVAFENRLAAATALQHDHLLVGSGVAIGDYDGDGRPDLYFSRLEGTNALYRNLGGWRFEEVTEPAGVGAPDRYSTGATFADVDGDGRLDLFVTALGGPNALFLNRGDGSFEEVAEAAGLASELGSTSAAFADVDADGDLDLYVANYKTESAADVLRPYEQASVDLVVEVDGERRIAEAFRGHFRLETRDGVEVAVEQADPDRLYLNDGALHFEQVSWTGGRFLDAEGVPLTRDVDDFGLAARFYDVDHDGDPDLYVCNDFDDPDYLWLNDGSGTFTLVDAYALRTQSHASMAVDFSDVNRDGVVDFFVADMLSSDPGRRLAQVPLHASLQKPPGRIADRPQAGRNTLFLGRGDGTWAQIAEMAGVDGSEWTWGSLFLDVDLDGFEDLLVANGHGRDMRDGDALQRVTDLRGSVTWDQAKSLYPDLPTRNRAFRNRGDLTFEEVGDEWGFSQGPDVSHGIATGDLDGDGDLDVVINRLNQSPLLLRNDASGARVAVRLLADGANTGAVGARVRLLGAGGAPSGTTAPVLFQDKEITAGGLYLSGSETVVTFAAGRGGAVPGEALTLEITWPSGGVTRLSASANRMYEVREASAEPAPAVASAPEGRIFEDVSNALASEHLEGPFADFERQPLLPYQLSRLGPGVTWADLDLDGDPDLVVAAGQGSRATVMRNDGGGFTAIPGAATAHDQTTVLPSWGDGTVSLIVGQTSFDAGSPEEARSLDGVVRIAWNGGTGSASLAGPHLSSVGPLAQADVDGDGDLDLFVGGRTVPAFYPLPATSRLLIKEGGVYRVAEQAAFRDLALVSGAVFTDIDDDGDPDLALAPEWGSVRLFLNEAGTFVDATARWGLSELTGLWRGISAGDLDGDGRMDLVASNEGLNSRLVTTPDRPLTVVHGDVDQNGTWEVLLARARDGGGALYPLARYEQTRVALPSLRSRVGSFDSYSRSTLADVMGADPRGFFFLRAATLEHTVLLNRGGRFETEALPTEAQLAPAHHVGVADVDGDGNEDVVLTQNFFPTDGFTPRYDAGRALLMLGDGTGSLRPVSADRSGLIVYGDQRGAAFADFDMDGRIDLAVAQNGTETKLFHNVGARPGLRVVLEGPPENPTGIGARLRLVYDGSLGPAREVRSGSGYWSSDDAVQVLGFSGTPTAVQIRWPDSSVAQQPIAVGATEVLLRWASS
ncbi:MAG: FG-GAP-like repeat-containing protein [Gemmatimonadota bacterium]|nr:FG-GAP-like repeat-containing protein [Gemmatimonadota bacterium]